MQDSLEEYLKLTGSCQEGGTKKNHKENRTVITEQLKKECQGRALKIVEFSLEGKLRPEVFSRCLPFINQSYYQDIVEERAITKLCGYPICGKRIPSDMPKKQYFISTKSNKVYDITDRKNYCSNFCYKASLHIKKQIDNSPLWLRTKLEDISEYKLLNNSQQGGLPGETVNHALIKPINELKFTSIGDFAEVSLGDITNDNEKIKKVYKKQSKLISKMQTIKENEIEEDAIIIKQAEVKKDKTNKIKIKRRCIIRLPSIEENEEKNSSCDKDVIANLTIPMIGISQKNSKDSLENNSNTKLLNANIEKIITKVFDEWITLETCIFIHGEEKVKLVLNEEKLSDYFEEFHVVELQREQQIKYMEICRRLKLQEMLDDKIDKCLVEHKMLQPLPDFDKLKENTKDMKLKVKSLYEGDFYEQDDKNFPVKAEAIVSSSKETDNEKGPPAVLPPMDVSSQKLLRRKIFLNSASKAIQQLLHAIDAPYSAILSDINALVKTFNLKADNITFKPSVWTVIAFLLLNVLALKDQTLSELLEEPRSKAYVEILTAEHPNLIAELLQKVRSLEEFVEQYILKKTNNN